MPLDSIKENLFAYIRKEGTTVPFDGLDMQWEKVKDKVVMRLINLERNSLYVAGRVYRPLEGTSLGLIYDIDVGCTREGSARLCVTEKVRQLLGVSEEELCAAAYANTQRIAPASIRPITDVMEELMPGEDPSEVREPQLFCRDEQGKDQRGSGCPLPGDGGEDPPDRGRGVLPDPQQRPRDAGDWPPVYGAGGAESYDPGGQCQLCRTGRYLG